MFQPNSVIAGRYQVVRLVGQGGMSNLYLAYDRKYSNATVVIKEMTATYSDPKEQQMAVDLFHREAKLLASLNHRHIPKVFDYFQFAGKYYLSMEYIDGVDLAVKLEEQKGPLPEAQVLEWGQQIATVLFYLHKHEPPIVFRDVKPSNIMISSKGVKLIDFGIARHFDQAKKGDTMRIGSPGYAPPEQYAAQTDPRSDIYALGVTLHHALTGRDPTATNTPFLMPPARAINPALSEATAAMLARATQLDPSDRYQSALDFKKDIQLILSGNSSSANVGAAPTPAAPPQVASAASASPAATGAAAASGPATPATPSTPAAQTAGNQAAAPGTPSGSLAVAANSTPSGNLTPPTTQNNNKKKKKPGFAKMLLVAGVFAVSAAVAGLASLPAQTRQELWQRTSRYARAALHELKAQDEPEFKLRQALLSGSSESLLPLLQSADFKSLSAEKQELFRQDLLAALANKGNLRVVTILAPEETENPELWKSAASAVQMVNSNGGLGQELLVVVPDYYSQGTLAEKIQRLSSQQEKTPQNILVVGASQENLSSEQSTGENFVFYGLEQQSGKNVIPSLPVDSESLTKLFDMHFGAESPPTVWGIPGTAPSDTLGSDLPLTPPLNEEMLKSLVAQAQAANGLLILLADQAREINRIQGPGKVVLLALSPPQLPEPGPGLDARARVLSSPFEAPPTKDAYHANLPGDEAMTLDQARLFDAIIMASLPKGMAYQGITLARNKDGAFENKGYVPYRWTGKSWLPALNEAGKSK